MSTNSSQNQKISKRELVVLRSLDDFDLIMLISDIHDHGWPIAKGTFCSMLQQDQYKNRPEVVELFKRYQSDPDTARFLPKAR